VDEAEVACKNALDKGNVAAHYGLFYLSLERQNFFGRSRFRGWRLTVHRADRSSRDKEAASQRAETNLGPHLLEILSRRFQASDRLLCDA
jgi:hypothetical protein